MHLGRVDDAGLEHVLVHASGGVVPNLDVAVLQHLRSGSILAACTSDTQPLQATSHPIRAGMTTVAASAGSSCSQKQANEAKNC